MPKRQNATGMSRRRQHHGYEREYFPVEVLECILHATPAELADIQRILKVRCPMVLGNPEPWCWEHGGLRIAEAEGSEKPGAEAEIRNPQSAIRNIFRWTGRDWEVVFNGGPALLHRPNVVISAFDLEVALQAEKGEARVRNSIQPQSDGPARRAYRQELERLEEKRAEAEAAGRWAEAERLEAEMEEYQAAATGNGLQADTGLRARDNVRKAVEAVRGQLRKGGPQAQAFVEHLRTELSLSHKCYYCLGGGAVWG